MAILFDSKNYERCSGCDKVFKKEELYLCDGIIWKQRALPCGTWENVTCSKYICKNCKHSVGGYDFCPECFKRRR